MDYISNSARLQKPPGTDRHNLQKGERDENGRLILKPLLKSKALKNSHVESASVCKPFGNDVPGTRKPSPDNLEIGHTQTGVSKSQKEMQVKKGTQKQLGLRVFRFLLCFEPPVLAVDWGKVGDTSSSSNLPHSPSSLTEKTRTNIQFSPDDFVDVNALAQKVILEQSFLSDRHLLHVKCLLKQLASSCLPVYQVVHRNGAVLCTDFHNLEKQRESAEQLFPLGALVLARERVRQHDGWWIRIWSGQWLQSSYAKQECAEEVLAERLNIEPSIGDVQAWLEKATQSQNKVLIENAAEVAKQAGVGQNFDDKAGSMRARQYSPRPIKKNCC